MEKPDPILSPQWLRNGGHVTSFSSASSSLHSDDHAPSTFASNRSLSSTNMRSNELKRHTASDRSSSLHSRQSSNRSSPNLRSYSSFSRNHSYRDMDKEITKHNVKSTSGNHWSRDLPDPLRKHRWSGYEEGLRRSESAVSGRTGEKWPTNSRNAGKNNQSDNNGLLASVSSVDSVADRGIMPLRTEERLLSPGIGRVRSPSLGIMIQGLPERQASPGIGRVRSPGLRTVSQCLPEQASSGTGNVRFPDMGTLTRYMLTGEFGPPAGNTAVVGNDCSSLPSVKQGASSGPSSPNSSKGVSRGLNMAETVAKGPPCSQTTSQLSHANHKHEQLAVKQSRQLIPLVAKASVPNPSNKLKTKVELQQQTVSSCQPASHSLSSKLCVLKPTRERSGVSSAVNNSLNPIADSKRTNTLLAVSPSSAIWSPADNAVSSTTERKPVGTFVEKKLSSHAQSRNEFFNGVRKNSTPSSSAVNDAGCAVLPSLDKSGVSEVLASPHIPQGQETSLSDESQMVELSTENMHENTCNGDSHYGKSSSSKSFSRFDAFFRSEAEETAFLRTMGWDENSDESDLTEEEISAFYRKCIDQKLSLRILQILQSRFLLPPNSGIGGAGGVSS